MRSYFGVGFVGLILEQRLCDMNEVTIPHELCIEKKTFCTTSSVSERVELQYQD